MRTGLIDFAPGSRWRLAFAIGLAGMAGVSAVSLLLVLLAFDSTPGSAAAPPKVWPSDTAIQVTAHRAHLLMFVHPDCGCTSASIAELQKIGALFRPESPDVRFVVFRVRNSGTVWNAAGDSRRIPASRVLWDEDGTEAKRFRARTSGTILLYNARGRLVFSGGITESRGHEGDNYGLTALSDLLDSRAPVTGAALTSRVFGCALTAEPLTTVRAGSGE